MNILGEAGVGETAFGEALAVWYFVTSPVEAKSSRLADISAVTDCKVGGSSGSPELVFMLLSGLITRYASLEKKRTFCPEPGVFLSRKMERTEPYCL